MLLLLALLNCQKLRLPLNEDECLSFECPTDPRVLLNPLNQMDPSLANDGLVTAVQDAFGPCVLSCFEYNTPLYRASAMATFILLLCKISAGLCSRQVRCLPSSATAVWLRVLFELSQALPVNRNAVTFLPLTSLAECGVNSVVFSAA